MHITRRQCRAARAALGWSQSTLAEQAGCHIRTVIDWENGHREMSANTQAKLIAAFSRAGITFLFGSQHGIQWTP